MFIFSIVSLHGRLNLRGVYLAAGLHASCTLFCWTKVVYASRLKSSDELTSVEVDLFKVNNTKGLMLQKFCPESLLVSAP